MKINCKQLAKTYALMGLQKFKCNNLQHAVESDALSDLIECIQHLKKYNLLRISIDITYIVGDLFAVMSKFCVSDL